MKLDAPGGPKPPMDPPPLKTRQTSILLFSNLYTSMVTKNKFFAFPARLTPPGSLSIGTYMHHSIFYSREI